MDTISWLVPRPDQIEREDTRPHDVLFLGSVLRRSDALFAIIRAVVEVNNDSNGLFWNTRHCKDPGNGRRIKRRIASTSFATRYLKTTSAKGIIVSG
jgi:hypothetical protein